MFPQRITSDTVRTALVRELREFLAALPADPGEDPSTGSLTEPGVYRDDYPPQWVAWNYDPDSEYDPVHNSPQDTITVTEADLTLRHLEQVGRAYALAQASAEAARQELRTAVRDMAECGMSESGIARVAGVTRMTVRKAVGK